MIENLLFFVFSAWYALSFSVTEVAFAALLFWMLDFGGASEVLVDTDRKEVSPARILVQACCEIGRIARSRYSRLRNVEHERLVALQAPNFVKIRKDMMRKFTKITNIRLGYMLRSRVYCTNNNSRINSHCR